MVFYDVISERRLLPVRLWHLQDVGKMIIFSPGELQVIKYDDLKRTRCMCGGHISTTIFRRSEPRGSGLSLFEHMRITTSSHSHITVQTVHSSHITSHASS